MPVPPMHSRLMNALLAAISVTLIASCSWLEEWNGSHAKAPQPQPQPQAQLMQTADATWLVPASDQKPMGKLVPAPDETTIETRERLDNMEQQLAGMQNDMKMIMPALTRLASLQVNLQELSQTPTAAAPTNVMPVAVAPAPVEKKLMPVPLVQKSAASAAPAQMSDQQPPSLAAAVQPAKYVPATTAQDIRFGTHPDKVRIVIDVDNEVGFTYNVDNDQKVLQIGLVGTAWKGQTQAAISDSPLVLSYDTQPDGQGGTQMILQLRQSAKVLWAQTLPPVGSKGPRLVIDIGPV